MVSEQGRCVLLGRLANQLLKGLLKGGDLLRKVGLLAVDLIPGWQAWGPVSVLEAVPVRTPFGRRLCVLRTP